MYHQSRRALASLLTVLVSATGLVGLAASAAQATEDPNALPTIVTPTEGEVIQGDFAGPISIDFSPVGRDSTWEVDAVSQGGCSQPAGTSKCAVSTSVAVTAATGVVDVTLPEPLGRSATYSLQVVESTGGLAAERTFTITGATDDTTPDPDPQPEAPGGRFVSPGGGTKVEEGYTGPLTLDFNNTGRSSRYILSIDHDRTGYATVYPTSSGGRQRVSIPALTEPGEYDLDLRNYDTGEWYDSIYLIVQAPKPVVTIKGVSPTTFYPTVRDGFRDSVTVRYRVDQRSTVSYRVKSAAGRTVATRTLAGRSSGLESFTWNGRDNDGETVPTGKYRIEVMASNADYRTGKATTTVTATSDVVSRRGHDSWNGTQTDRRAKRGNCTFYGYSGELTLDCWMGTYARAEYDFKVPANAANLQYHVRGQRNCCDEGTIAFTGKRATKTRYTVAVQVTNWRSYTIRQVDLTYTYRVRR